MLLSGSTNRQGSSRSQLAQRQIDRSEPRRPALP